MERDVTKYQERAQSPSSKFEVKSRGLQWLGTRFNAGALRGNGGITLIDSCSLTHTWKAGSRNVGCNRFASCLGTLWCPQARIFRTATDADVEPGQH